MIRVRWTILTLLLLWGIPAYAQSESCAPQWVSEWQITDFCTSNVDFGEILSGGVPKDAIPAVNDPAMERVEAAASWLAPHAPVIVVEINDEARAYPQAVLMWHEIANDTVGGVPVSVTFCPLCNSSLAFDRRVGDAVLDFGVSGKLRNSDLIMYDRQTESWWQQLTGEGIVGVYTDTLLDIVPSQVVAFGDFAAHHPDGLVMSRDTGFNRQYGTNPYLRYDSNDPRRFLFRGELDERLPATERVLAGIITGEAVAYPFSILSELRVLHDTAGEQPVVAFWQPGVASALDVSRIDEGRDIGGAGLFARTLEDGRVLDFVIDESGQITDVQTGSAWSILGEAVAGELMGTRLTRLAAAPHFWFAWAAFQPEARLYAPSE